MMKYLMFFLFFLSIKTQASTCVEFAREIFTRSDGVVSAVTVRDIDYARTNRGITRLEEVYKQGEVDLINLKGKRVLDAGTGGGDFVHYLQEQKIDAQGIDIFIDESQKKFSYLSEQDILNLEFSDGSFDTIFSSYSIFFYSDSKREVTKALSELKRVLADDGVIHIGPIGYTVGEILEGPEAKALFSKIKFSDEGRGTVATLQK